MASRAILAGIKTSAVINVGTATLGALIGAGGYGQPILKSIRLDNIGLILRGAVPAAVLVVFVQVLFEIVERNVVPKGRSAEIRRLMSNSNDDHDFEESDSWADASNERCYRLRFVR